MTDIPAPLLPPQATTRRSRRISIIWLVPVLALAIGLWLAWDTLSKEGPTIEVTFDNAEGLQAGQSQLKYKDIVFGTVKSLKLTPDQSHVVVAIATTREAKPLLTEKAVFWIVKPRLFAGQISGFETLLSGSFVGIVPGEAGGKELREFVGQEDPPLLTAHVPGHTFLLNAPRIGSITLGSPIFFHDVQVGEVLGWDVAGMAQRVTVHAFVRAPYDAYVKDDTRFWDASGLSINLGAEGVHVQVESLKALLLGGIAFDTPVREEHAAAAADNHIFPLFANHDAAKSASYTRIIPAISYFPGSVSGLAPGSEVTMHGLKVGEVTDVRLVFDQAKGTIQAAVHYEAQPERVVGIGTRLYKTDAESVGALLDHGMRASLETASLITGAQTVALEFDPDAGPAPVTREGPDFVIPSTEGGGFSGLASSASAVLDKVGKMPFAEIGANLNGILHSANAAIAGPELKTAVASLAATLASTRDLMKKLDASAGPAAKQLPGMTAKLELALNNVNKLLPSLQAGYGDDTKFNRDLDRLMVQSDDAVRSIRALADLLARHPEALIKGRSAGGIE